MNILKYLNKEEFNPLQKGPILFTMDADWSPDFILEEVLNMIPKGIYITLFATNPSPVLDLFQERGHEIGAHPNFLPGSSHGEDSDEVLRCMRNYFPKAKGLRSHSLLQSSPIQNKISMAGFSYDCNLLLYMQNYIQPYQDWYGIIRVPYVWEDNVCLQANKGYDTEYWLKQLSGPGLKIMNFYPLLITLNVNSSEAENYRALKHTYTDLRNVPEEGFNSYRNAGKGIGTLFRELISRLA